MGEYIRKPNSECLVCSKPVYRRPVEIEHNKGRVYCSSGCYGVASRKEKSCVGCNKPILARANKKTCSRACANKNRAGIKYKVGRPRDNAQTIRAIKLRIIRERGGVCERCAYSKQEILHVHHKDRNTKNNNVDNLELICPNCHYEEHYLEKSWLGNKERRVAPNGKALVLKTSGRKPL